MKRLFLGVETIIAPGAAKPNRNGTIEENVQCGTDPLPRPRIGTHDFIEVEPASVSLVGNGGSGEAVSQHHHPSAYGWAYHFRDMLGAVGEV